MSKYYTRRKIVKAHSQTYHVRDGNGGYRPVRKRKSSYTRDQRYRQYDPILREKALEQFEKRSEKAKAIDRSRTSKNVLDEPNEYWKENIGKSDVKGIDTKKVEEIKYARGKLKFYLKGFSAGRDWIKEISKENVQELKDLSEYEKYSSEWTKEDHRQAKRLYNEYLSTVNKFHEVSPTDTKVITFNGKKLTVLASTWEEDFNPITEENKKGMDKWIEEHPEAKMTDYNFRNYHPYIQDKIIKKSNLFKTHKKLNEILDQQSRLKGDMRILEKEMGKTNSHTQKFKKLVERHKKLEAKHSVLSKEFDKVSKEHDKNIAILKELASKSKPKSQIKKTPKKTSKPFLPKLTGDNKYILAYVSKEGYVRYIGYTKDPKKAIKELDAERKISKKLGIKKKIELFVAKDIDEVRDQVHTRGRDDYLITGDTYQNRKKIHSIANVKFDYNKKGFRGKLSNEELEELRKIPGLKFNKEKPITKTDKLLSEKAKAHSKAKKWLKHERTSGSIWQKEKPFKKEEISRWNSLTHFPRDWNKDFKESIDKKENEILKKLKINKIEDAPEDIQNAFDYYRKNKYNYIKERNRARQIAPPMYVVGPSKYPTHKIPKADAIEKRASDKLEKAEKTMKKITYQYVNLQPRKSAEEKRQERRETITPKLIKAQKEGKKIFSPLQREWYNIERVNKKTITVKSKTGDYTFTIDKDFISQIEN